MTTETIGFAVVGVVLIVSGFLSWKKQTMAFLHSYHYKNIKEEEIPEYTKLMGIGQIVIGTAFCLAALLSFFPMQTASWVVFIIELAAGLVFILKAQSRHKGSLF